jgi:glucose/arabinose dehydrogenase
MTKWTFLALASAVVVAGTGFVFFNNSRAANKSVESAIPAMTDTLQAAVHYRQYCGGCHGEKMDAFVDRQWKHGNTRADLFKAVKFGYYDEGMPAFDSAFTDAEIYALADYMLEGIERFREFEFKEEPKVNSFEGGGLTLKLDTVVSGLRSIWAMAFLPKGEMLITEKHGTLYRVDKDRKKTAVTGLPKVFDANQGGLLDVVLHPDYSKNGIVYVSYSAVRDDNGKQLGTTAILRAKLHGNQLVDGKVIFEAFPYSTTRHHYGSRMVFGRDGMLYFSVGDRGNEKENPQNLGNDLGKIHRVREDGSVPADNPFVNTAGARPTIWSYGHRNPQGLTVNPSTGEIWSHEHGPRGGDEINLIKKGANYGWPVITYGINYNGKIISNKTSEPGMEQPVQYWIPSIGPCGMAFVEGNRYKGWQGQLLSGSLRFKYLNLSFIKNKEVTREEKLLKNLGRLRDVRMSPDGYIYVAVEEPGLVFRLLPQ